MWYILQAISYFVTISRNKIAITVLLSTKVTWRARALDYFAHLRIATIGGAFSTSVIAQRAMAVNFLKNMFGGDNVARFNSTEKRG